MLRKPLSRCLVLAPLLLVPAAWCALGGPETRATLQVGAVERTYRLFVPTAPAAGPRPLVLAFHGGFGNGRGMARLSGLSSLAERRGYVVAYPDGMDRHWNDARTELLADRGDLRFVEALIDHLARTQAIDRSRVYAIGMSNGAMFSQRLACEMAGRFAAIAAVAGSMPEHLEPVCRPERPISVLMIHGTEDRLVPYEGGPVGGSNRRERLQGRVISAHASVRRWTALDGCNPEPRRTALPDADPADGTTAAAERYTDCQDGSEVALYTVTGAGHTWPGGLAYLPRLLIGRTSRDFDASALALDFFDRHPGR